MDSKVCPNCLTAHSVTADYCPKCWRVAKPYNWDQASRANVGCLIAFVIFVLILISLPLFLIAGLFFR